MGTETKIEWADHTFNGWWGCVKVSPACTNCYAATFSNRYKFDLWGLDKERRFFGEKHWNEPLKWNKIAEKEKVRKRVFCGSMMDIAEDREDIIVPRKRIFDLVEKTPWLDWLFLSKRPENYVNVLPVEWLENPMPNVWLGTTVENDKYLWRADELLKVNAAIHFLSVEPLLGPLDLTRYLVKVIKDFSPTHLSMGRTGIGIGGYINEFRPRIDWVIVGGESGHSARPMHPDWVHSLKSQCERSNVPFFFKQWGEWSPGNMIENTEKYQSRIIAEDGYLYPKGFTFKSSSTPHDYHDVDPPGNPWVMLKVGKKIAGRLLVGSEYNELPNADEWIHVYHKK